MDIRKYLVQLNSSGELVPLIYDRNDEDKNRQKIKPKKRTIKKEATKFEQ